MSSSPLLPSQPSLPDGSGGSDGSQGGGGGHVEDGDLAVLLAAADDRVPAGGRPDGEGLVLPDDWWTGLDPEVLDDPDLPAEALPHVRRCPGCQGRLVALAPQLHDLSALLGSLADQHLPPAPDIALPPPPPASRPATVTPLPERRPRRLASPALLRVAAAVAAVAVVGSVGVSVLRSSGGASSTSAQGVARGESDSAAGAAAGAAGGAAGQSASAAASAPAEGPSGSGGTLFAAAGPSLMHSDTDYRPATLPQQVAALLATPKAASGTAGPTMAESVAACVQQVAPGRTDVTVDEGRWNGRSALVIVARAGEDAGGASRGAGPAEVWAVTPDCGSTPAPTLLTHQLVPAP